MRVVGNMHAFMQEIAITDNRLPARIGRTVDHYVFTDHIVISDFDDRIISLIVKILRFGSNDSTADSSNLIVMTLKSQSTDLTKAEGTKVKDIPSDLPKVTNAADGKPSIDMNGYKDSDKLVVQPLIEGDGEKLDSNSYAVVKYTGWLLDGKQFDSSWDRNSTFDVNMQGGVIEGWLEGLKGQKVGSEVLLVVPPSLGYGDQAQGEIPANSTLVFVVDILAKY